MSAAGGTLRRRSKPKPAPSTHADTVKETLPLPSDERPTPQQIASAKARYFAFPDQKVKMKRRDSCSLSVATQTIPHPPNPPTQSSSPPPALCFNRRLPTAETAVQADIHPTSSTSDPDPLPIPATSPQDCYRISPLMPSVQSDNARKGAKTLHRKEVGEKAKEQEKSPQPASEVSGIAVAAFRDASAVEAEQDWTGHRQRGSIITSSPRPPRLPRSPPPGPRRLSDGEYWRWKREGRSYEENENAGLIQFAPPGIEERPEWVDGNAAIQKEMALASASRALPWAGSSVWSSVRVFRGSMAGRPLCTRSESEQSQSAAVEASGGDAGSRAPCGPRAGPFRDEGSQGDARETETESMNVVQIFSGKIPAARLRQWQPQCVAEAGGVRKKIERGVNRKAGKVRTEFHEMN
uniref:Uncharacterized protein n=1 Tax=Chromera velia CCMP2878 TaxID=1169474 RepID=A0A0G4I1Y1_9ALVE|eukprot:Cvel_34901.t1-p1 / transcript=Cvel_34901.t1 / gene=Cvel_34901 / organism=Chromera_velia_CCMP2878 / gene_product=hypothetical protein / transcript_product=hypothetical protein / location=Cvel_scaffold6159:171-1391(-) / protein_length=407 / sequence_SO=supercontig / SO=protein_coding / is_pseudo=false